MVQYAFALIDGIEVRAAHLTGVIGLTPVVSGYLCSANEILREQTEVRAAHTSSQPGASTPYGRSSSLLLLDSSAEPNTRVIHGGATILGRHSAVPVLEWLPLESNELQALCLVGLDVSLSRLPDLAAQLRWEWTPDGIQLHAGQRHRVLPWQRRTPWPADSINQGVFRWEPSPT